MTHTEKVALAMAWYDSGLEDRAAFQTLMESLFAHPEPMTEFEEAVAAGDATLNHAIDHWQERALKAEALAQPEQESFSPEAISATQAAWKMGYDAAKAEQPEQELVQFEAWLAKQHGDPEEIGFLQALRIAYIAGQDSITTPPQRTWVGLTEQDKWEILLATERDDRDDVMEMTEAKLKEKNT